MKKSNPLESAKTIRQKAEELLQIKNSTNQIPFNESDNLKIVHELQVHQIELEMQQEELLLAIQNAEIAKEKYIALFDFAPSGYITLSKTNNITVLNHAAAFLFGEARENLINKNIVQFIAEDFKSIFYDFLNNVLNSSKKQNITIQIIKKDKTIIDILLTATFLLNKEEFNIIAIDITERVNENEKIKLLSLAIEQSPSSVIITDSNGDIEYVNKKFTEISGYQFEEVIGKNPRFLKSEHTSLEEYKLLWETIKMGNTWEGLFINKKKDGEFYWESAKIFQIKNLIGKNIHFLSIQEDITQQKFMENKMEKIAWHQSHEVRAPLTNILAIIAAMNLKISIDEKLTLLNSLDKSAKKLDAAIHSIVRQATDI